MIDANQCGDISKSIRSYDHMIYHRLMIEGKREKNIHNKEMCGGETVESNVNGKYQNDCKLL